MSTVMKNHRKPVERLPPDFKHVKVAVVDGTQQLSATEMQVVRQLCEGKTYQQIADSLGIGFETVKTYLQRIRTKLNVNSKVQIVLWAVSQKLIRG